MARGARKGRGDEGKGGTDPERTRRPASRAGRIVNIYEEVTILISERMKTKLEYVPRRTMVGKQSDSFFGLGSRAPYAKFTLPTSPLTTLKPGVYAEKG